ncbi:EAL domain-containing protein [Halomonas alkaliantarctica]|uniref:bifunctional diguanylate cyclase/phosphodiesterase n=1 Tax=Halomonas alkaliantarctica TaxID=232346 RepID=UPI0004AAA432|nr:EAL domain-containing protein [Halomonas alkaliantarctica]
MKIHPPPTPHDEPERLKALWHCTMNDRHQDTMLERITSMVANLYDAPYVLVSFVDEECQWFKSHHGLTFKETPRDISFCAHALCGEGIFEITDATQDTRFVDNPLVTGPPHIRYYLGAPLVSREGYSLGTLCILDTKTRVFSQAQRTHLATLADLVIQRLELHRLHCQERIVTTSGLGLWELDIASGATWWNDVVYTLYGVAPDYSHDKANGISVYTAEDQRQLETSLAKAANQQVPFDLELRLAHKDKGLPTWVRVTGVPVTVGKETTQIAGTIQDITPLKKNERRLDRQQRLERLITHLQTSFIAEHDLSQAFSDALAELVALTESDSGFIGEVLYDDKNTPFLKTHAITDISWDHASRRLFEKASQGGIVFSKQASLFGHVLQTGEMLIANAPDQDPRRGGLPKGHPPLNAFIGIPVTDNGTLIAMIGLANRPGGYQACLMEELASFLRNLGQLISSLRLRVQHDEAHKRLELSARIFSDSQNAIMITDQDNRIVDVNRAFELMTGYTRGDVLNHQPSFLSSGCHTQAFYQDMWQSLLNNGSWRGELINRRKNGELLYESLSLSLIRNAQGDITHHVAIFSDMTRLKKHAEELHRASHFDKLTLLPNRHQMLNKIREAIAHVNDGNTLAIGVLDLDDFKKINQQFGYKAADNVLISVAQQLRDRVGPQGVVARLGGDEFALLLHDMNGKPEQLRAITKSFVLEQPNGLESSPVVVNVSLGITLFPLDDADPDTLLRHADQAMYQAKLQGGNTFAFFDPDHEKKLKAQQTVRNEISQALNTGQFELYFQPQIDARSLKLLGVEALIRWNHPKRGLVMPDQFLPLISGTDTELALDAWVMEGSLTQLSAWQKERLDIDVSINLTPQSLVHEQFIDTLRDTLSRHPDVSPHSICIEVLESAALDDLPSATQILNRCRETGCKVALDDFGTGYSSLSYLRNLPVDLVKIDKSFVMGMLKRPEDLAIVESITYLAKRFNKQVVAEGAESDAHIETLQRMGCDFVQGYGVARPMPASQLLSWSKREALEKKDH